MNVHVSPSKHITNLSKGCSFNLRGFHGTTRDKTHMGTSNNWCLSSSWMLSMCVTQRDSIQNGDVRWRRFAKPIYHPKGQTQLLYPQQVVPDIPAGLTRNSVRQSLRYSAQITCPLKRDCNNLGTDGVFSPRTFSSVCSKRVRAETLRRRGLRFAYANLQESWASGKEEKYTTLQESWQGREKYYHCGNPPFSFLRV